MSSSAGNVRGETFWNRLTFKQQKCVKALGIIGIVALVGILMAGFVFLSIKGRLGHGLKDFMGNTFPYTFKHTVAPWIKGTAQNALQIMHSKVPAWTVPAAAGGAFVLGLLGLGASRLHQSCKPKPDINMFQDE